MTVIGNRGVFNKEIKRAFLHFGERPFLLPVGDKEEEGDRSDDEVDKEDHQQPAHDIPEV